MIELPPPILTLYRNAETADVRRWSYGALKRPRVSGARSWEKVRGTLEDQAIFGPVVDYACACGRRNGFDQNGIVCNLCGVKIGPSSVRRQRFAHVELPLSLPHPFGHRQGLEAFPVLPAAFFTSPAGTALADLYDDLVAAADAREGRPIELVVTRICDLLTPVFLQANDWNLSDAHALARGLAMEYRPAAGEYDDRCDHCGYPLSGLSAAVCPHCGRRTRPRD